MNSKHRGALSYCLPTAHANTTIVHLRTLATGSGAGTIKSVRSSPTSGFLANIRHFSRSLAAHSLAAFGLSFAIFLAISFRSSFDTSEYRSFSMVYLLWCAASISSITTASSSFWYLPWAINPFTNSLASAVQIRQLCRLLLQHASTILMSCTSVFDPTHIVIRPASSLIGTALLKCQRYSPSARRKRCSDWNGSPVSNACRQCLAFSSKSSLGDVAEHKFQVLRKANRSKFNCSLCVSNNPCGAPE